MLWRRRPCACTRVSRLPTVGAEEAAGAGMVFVMKEIDGEAPAGAEEADAGAEEADAGAEEAEAGAVEADEPGVTVMKTVDPGAVTVTVWVAPTWPCALEAEEVAVGAALDCCCALEVGEAAAVLVASLLAGCDELPAGLPPTRYFGIGGLEIEVLKPAARVVGWESEAGTSLLVAEV